ncbi:MAG TPA: hypothetical protein PLL69_00910 [Gemmatimonadales bacterium]|nr:hypothetical protein [Gemmatimonadales bacterium]
MPNVHIDAVLGPERNPRQGSGFGAADILRWSDNWRRLVGEFRAAREPARQDAGPEGASPSARSDSTGMDEFFTTAA